MSQGDTVSPRPRKCGIICLWLSANPTELLRWATAKCRHGWDPGNSVHAKQIQSLSTTGKHKAPGERPHKWMMTSEDWQSSRWWPVRVRLSAERTPVLHSFRRLQQKPQCSSMYRPSWRDGKAVSGRRLLSPFRAVIINCSYKTKNIQYFLIHTSTWIRITREGSYWLA